jgi:ABC-type bacteriocin/lantibiotic exporter with double-glycine peptidase domain
MNKNSILNLLSRLWYCIDYTRRLQLFSILVLIILSSISEVISLGAVIPFLGALSNPEKLITIPIFKNILIFFRIQKPTDILLPMTLFFIFAVLASGFMRIFLLRAQTNFSFKVGTDFAHRTFRKVLYQPYPIQINRNSSKVISDQNKVSDIANAIILPVLTLISSTFILSMLLITLIIINPIVAITSFVGFGLIYMMIIILTKNKLNVNSNITSLENVKILKTLQEGLGGIRDIIVDGTQEFYSNLYNNSNINLRKAEANINFIGASPRYILESFGMILIATLSYLYTKNIKNSINIITIMGVLALGAQRMLPILQTIYNSWISIKGRYHMLNDALSLLELSNPIFFNTKSAIPIEFHNNIHIKDVSFSYQGTNKIVLKNIDIKIYKGQKIGIIGITGSGKSTLLDIIMGLLIPQQGSMFIDGNPINSINSRNWQIRISHVPQSIYLSDSTIAENIAFGIAEKNIDHKKIIEAARKANLYETIENLEMKFQTYVGERGIRLSGGQRQRIGIARALYKNADVIILDEATSALDNKTEEDVMEAIKNLNVDITIIIVAHRITTLKNCDHIFELENGKLFSRGKFDEIQKY